MGEGYREVRILDFRGWAREPWPTSIPLSDLLSEIGQPTGTVVKMRRHRAIKVRGDLHVKEEFLGRWTPWPLILKGIWGRGRLERQWRSSLLARGRGIPTPEPLAYLEKRRGFLPSRSLLVTRYEPEFVTLTRYLREKGQGGIWIMQQGGPFLEWLARSVRQMHEKGTIHGDLKGSNILVQETAEGWSLLFTDLKAARFFIRQGGKERAFPSQGEADTLRLLAALRPFFPPEARALFLPSYLSLDAQAAQQRTARWEAKSRRKFPGRGSFRG